jgi:hypothetical protein
VSTPHRRADPVALLRGQHEDEPAAHAEPDGADLRRGHGLVAEQDVDGACQVARGLLDGQLPA